MSLQEPNVDGPPDTHNDSCGTLVFLAVFVICLIYLAFLVSGLFEFGFLGLVVVIASLSLSRLAKIPPIVGGLIAAAVGYGLLIETFAVSNFT